MTNEKLEISYGRKGYIYYRIEGEQITITDYSPKRRNPKLFEKILYIDKPMTVSEVGKLIQKKENLNS